MGLQKLGFGLQLCPFLKFETALVGSSINRTRGMCGTETHLDNRVDQEDSLRTEGFEPFLSSWLALTDVQFEFGHPLAHLVQIGFPVESTIGSVTMCPPSDYVTGEYWFLKAAREMVPYSLYMAGDP